MIQEIRIFDFDGVLVDSSHRYRTQICADGVERIDLDYWIANEHRAGQDKPLPTLAIYRQCFENKSIYPIIATARVWDSYTQQWAVENGLPTRHIIARKNRQDTRGGAELKITGVKRLLNLRQFSQVSTIRVFEDNQTYLHKLCNAFNALPHYIPSGQGH